MMVEVVNEPVHNWEAQKALYRQRKRTYTHGRMYSESELELRELLCDISDLNMDLKTIPEGSERRRHNDEEWRPMIARLSVLEAMGGCRWAGK